MPYSSPSMRYNLRMRPFLSISLPQVPSFPEFTSLVSLPILDGSQAQSININSSNSQDPGGQAHSILDVADQALNIARKEWEAVSKSKPEIARCVECEDWWRPSIKNVLRSCIATSIMVASVKKATANIEAREMHNVLSLEIPSSDNSYHPWWIIPRITLR